MKVSWKEQILKELAPRIGKMTLVADPDELLLEESILQDIRELGFELITFDEHIAFRFAYESKFRRDTDKHTNLIVRTETQSLSSLPYDLLQAGRKLHFSLGNLFPNLSYPVIASLDISNLDALYQAQQQNNPGTLGDNATKEFVLRHVFEIAPELIKQPANLLRTLLRRHFRKQGVPPCLDERFIEVLQQNGQFNNWPLDKIVPDRNAFFAFLQERWPVFLDKLAGKKQKTVQSNADTYQYKGPVNLPFDHDDVRIYIDNLFIEGMLKPIQHKYSDSLFKTWVSVGIKTDPESDRLKRLRGLIKNIKTLIPSKESRHQEWLDFAYKWAEFTVLALESSKTSEVRQELSVLQEKIDSSFLAWVSKRYGGLHNQPPAPPVMLHHIPKAMARYIHDSEQSKIALIVIDGLALNQWVVLRNTLSEQQPALQFKENAVYAWVPTITSVSRQTLFAGKLPLYFPGSVQTTVKEASLWSQFWIDHGLNQSEILYLKGLGNGNIENLRESISNPNTRVVGLVINTVDKIMHGMELGTSGMHNQIRQWTEEGYMAELIDMLHKLKFKIWLTSDHGNIEANGCGSPSEGVTAEVRGERVRIYPTEILRTQVKQEFHDAIEWPSIGLPDNFIPLLTPNRSAFVKKGRRIVGHGGISIEELIVPLIEIE